jgi:hypothetical protein
MRKRFFVIFTNFLLRGSFASIVCHARKKLNAKNAKGIIIITFFGVLATFFIIINLKSGLSYGALPSVPFSPHLLP